MPKTKDAFALRSIHEILETYTPADGEFAFDRLFERYERFILQLRESRLVRQFKKPPSKLEKAIIAIEEEPGIDKAKYLIETSKHFKVTVERHIKRLNELLKSYALLLVSERAKDVTAQVYRLNKLLESYGKIGNFMADMINFQTELMRSTLRMRKSRVQKLFGERLRRARTRAGYTGGDLAFYLGIKPNTYWEYERGSTVPSLAGLRILAKMCDVSVDWLLFMDT